MGREIFPDLLGNSTIKQNLAVDAAQGKSAHAYIIEGSEGSGKHLLARLVAASAVCANRDSHVHPLPCGTCPTCHRILNNLSADVTYVTLNGKASIGVEAIRNLKQNLYVTPNDGEKKFYVIENAELMTVQAQNSLLLSLEEPPEYVMFFLLTTHSSGLLETIRSRAPTVRMESFSPKTVLQHLKSGRFPETKGVSEDRLTEAAYLSDGAIGQALTLLSEKGEVTEHRRLAADLAEALTDRRRPSELLEFMGESMPTDREAVLSVLCLTQTAIRDVLASSKGEEDNLLFYLSADRIPKDSLRLSPKRLIGLYSLLRQTAETIAMNGSVPTALTELALNKDKIK